jgi:hypothetical protein
VGVTGVNIFWKVYMKKTLFVTVLFLLTCFVFSQERIAVFPFEDMDNILTKNDPVLFYRQFSNEFSKRNAGKFIIVPRQDVDKLIDTEMNFQISDLSEKVKTADYQRVLNGTRILSGVIGKRGNGIRISISLYTFPELGQLPNGVDLDVANVDELFNKIPELVQKMQNEIVKENAKPTVTAQPAPNTQPVVSTHKTDSSFWTLGVSAGSSFAAPWLIGTVHATLVPFQYSFLEIGLDFGLLSGKPEIDYYSLYPFAHYALFLPFNRKGGWYIGTGAGCMILSYTFPEGLYTDKIFAADIITGFNIGNFFDVSYTLRTNFSNVSNKLSLGYVYRFN